METLLGPQPLGSHGALRLHPRTGPGRPTRVKRKCRWLAPNTKQKSAFFPSTVFLFALSPLLGPSHCVFWEVQRAGGRLAPPVSLVMSSTPSLSPPTPGFEKWCCRCHGANSAGKFFSYLVEEVIVWFCPSCLYPTHSEYNEKFKYAAKICKLNLTRFPTLRT